MKRRNKGDMAEVRGMPKIAFPYSKFPKAEQVEHAYLKFKLYMSHPGKLSEEEIFKSVISELPLREDKRD